MDAEKENRSLSQLIVDLQRESSTLVRDEVALVRAEINEKVSQALNGVISLLAGALVAFSALIIVLIAIAEFLITLEMAGWLAYLIVGAVVLIIGVIMLMKGKSNLQPANLAPRRTAEELRRDREMVREQAR
ncbi:MAG TPA: phage holin family protein [Geminicoccaceae bacterium]